MPHPDSSMTKNDRLHYLLSLAPDERLLALKSLSEAEQQELAWHWRLWARAEQLAPPGEWRTWLIMAGRGFGKTRAGAEWVREIATGNPEARIALVGASLGEARAVMVEGESGILAISPPGRRPRFEPSLRRLTWPNGAQATIYSAGEPDSLRGSQASHACRPSTKGSLGERGFRAHRCSPPLCDRRRAGRPPFNSARRRNLACGVRGPPANGRAGTE